MILATYAFNLGIDGDVRHCERNVAVVGVISGSDTRLDDYQFTHYDLLGDDNKKINTEPILEFPSWQMAKACLELKVANPPQPFKKITHGFVVQVFDANGECTSQSFSAGDPVDYESLDGSRFVDAQDERYMPYDMVQPKLSATPKRTPWPPIKNMTVTEILAEARRRDAQ